MSTSAKAKTIIPKVTKALAWKYFTDNNNGTTVTCTLCKPKDVRVKVFEITNPKYYNLRYPKSHLRIQENCTIILQAIGGSTKGVRVHLSLHHKGEWKEIEEKEREKKVRMRMRKCQIRERGSSRPSKLPLSKCQNVHGHAIEINESKYFAN